MHLYNILTDFCCFLGNGVEKAVHTAIHLTNEFCHKDLVKSLIDHLRLNNELMPILSCDQILQ